MAAFQTQTFVPLDGNLSITLPEHFRGADVELSISKKKKTKRRNMSKEEHIIAWMEWVESIQGTLSGVDYSDLRDETDREL
jgi:hypothetical protein